MPSNLAATWLLFGYESSDELTVKPYTLIQFAIFLSVFLQPFPNRTQKAYYTFVNNESLRKGLLALRKGHDPHPKPWRTALMASSPLIIKFAFYTYF
jgi:hypothetical protein